MKDMKLILAASAAAAMTCCVSAKCPVEDGRILVGVTGYDMSPERHELMTNDECNLWVQWSKSENLLPDKLGRDWFEWAVSNRIHVMTIYGNQGGGMTKRLRETWGPLYLGNNIGEYAGFLYQGEPSYRKEWPTDITNLKDAHDWLVGKMLAAPKAAQMERPPDAREPNLFSTSGSPLACYELDGGIDYICNEMYAVGCGNLAYSTAEARGATRRRGGDWWSAWLAHEWQTCWLRLPYGVKQKYDSLLVGLKELWVMGTGMMVLESGSQGTQAHDYTPPDGSMKELKTKKQGYDGDVPKAYRRTMKEFYQWVKAHPRAAGSPKTEAALLLGNYDGYVGMTHDIFSIYGQHHIAKTNSNWKVGAPEYSWNAAQDVFFPRPPDCLRPFANGWIGGTPYGQVDVVNVDDLTKPCHLSRYRAVAFGGWNTMTPKIAETLRRYVSDGGQVVIATPQLSGRIDREYSAYTAADLVQAVPDVTVLSCGIADGGLAVAANAPDFLKEMRKDGAVHRLRVADVKLGSKAKAVVSIGKKPYLVKVRHGKGAFWVCLAWDYPGARDGGRTAELRIGLWKTLLAGVLGGVQSERIGGPDKDYVNWSIYGDRFYFLNTDCVSRRTVKFRGTTFTLEPGEVKEVMK